MINNNSNLQQKSANSSQLNDIVSGFKEVLQKYGASDNSTIEVTLIDQKLVKAGASLLPQGCKHKCWYDPAINSTQCGIVCNIG